MMGSSTKVLGLQRLTLQGSGGPAPARLHGQLRGRQPRRRAGRRQRDGAPDLWPRVVVRKLADPKAGLLDENDLDRNGVLDADSPSCLHADSTLDGKPCLVVLAAGLVPDGPIAALTDEQGNPRMTPAAIQELQVAVLPAGPGRLERRAARPPQGASQGALHRGPDPIHRPDMAGTQRTGPGHLPLA